MIGKYHNSNLSNQNKKSHKKIKIKNISPSERKKKIRTLKPQLKYIYIWRI